MLVRLLYILLLLAPVVFASNDALSQKSKAFPEATPESQGLSSTAIDSFLTAIGESKHEFHSVMILRHGKAIAQAWWEPYLPEYRHSLYSVSKSFTSTAIGFAVSEKLLTVNDKVISFFPDKLPDSISPFLAQLKVKDLLTMSVGHAKDPTFEVANATNEWIKSFLAVPIQFEPGKHFVYNSLATYMLSAIVQKVTGQKEIDYLMPRLFTPLGISGIDWEVSNEGVNTGGWGLRVKTEDLAKMGQLYLQKGKWNGKQVIPESWVTEATTFKIDQAPDSAQSVKAQNDWMQGYCYQFWRCRNNAFRADGAFGQYIVVMPDQDVVVAITSESSNMGDELNLIWKYLLPGMKKEALPPNETAYKLLEKKLSETALKPMSNNIERPAFTKRSFQMEPNDLNIKSIGFLPSKNQLVLFLKTDSAGYPFRLSSGNWVSGTTTMMGPALTEKAKESNPFLSPFKIMGSYGWQNDTTMVVKLRYIETPHSETITCNFNGNNLTARFEKSFDNGKNPTILTGAVKK